MKGIYESWMNHPSQPHPDEQTMLYTLAAILVIMGVAAFISLAVFLINAPYGRYSNTSWGPLVPGNIAWAVQESPTLFFVCYSYLHANPNVIKQDAAKILLLLFTIHYTNRTLIFPWRTRGGKPTPFSVMMMSFFYCVFNGYIQTRYLTQFASFPTNWIYHPQFILGVIMFIAGMLINIHSDHILINLRKPGDTAYHIPKGGMFNYVSGANFFGEILEWSGFAVAAAAWPALSFAIFTFSNIGPRGYQHHLWYLKQFKDKYPKNRKAVIPFIW